MPLNARDVLRLGYGLVPIVAGADKFTNLLCDWEQYLSPAAERALPMKGRTFMKLVGLIEIGAGLAVLSPYGRLGAYVVSGWLSAIALNLIASRRHYDVAARDALLAVGAYALGRLGEERERDLGPAPLRSPLPQAEPRTSPALQMH